MNYLDSTQEVIAVSDINSFVSSCPRMMRATFTIIDHVGMEETYLGIFNSQGGAYQKIRLEPQDKNAKLFIVVQSKNPKEPADDFYIKFYNLPKEDKNAVKQFMIDYNFLTDGELIFEQHTGCQVFTIGQFLSHLMIYRQNFFMLMSKKAHKYAKEMDESIEKGMEADVNVFGNWDEMNRHLGRCYYEFKVKNGEYEKVFNTPDLAALSYLQLVEEALSEELFFSVCRICHDIIPYSRKGRPKKYCDNCDSEDVKREYNNLFQTEIDRPGLTGQERFDKQEEIIVKAREIVSNKSAK